ncbi:MAG: DUF3352 domain-containing protein [Pyrinomonadaceae bacterium]
MKKFRRNKNWPRLLITLIGTVVLLASPVVAQQKRSTPPKKPAIRQAAQPIPTFDNLLAADSYRIYGEVRGVGALIRSQAVKDLLDPVMMLTAGGPPKELRRTLKWLNAHAEVLAGSRMLIAAWPARPRLPTVLIAIEFSSVEEAQKFEPELRGFIPTLIPTPTPSPTSSPAASTDQALLKRAPSNPSQKPEEPTSPPFQMKQAGSLVLMSDQPFAFRDLAPRGSKLVGEDPNFATARNRFAAESLFLYVDVTSIEKEQREQFQKAEEEARRRAESEAANPTKQEESPIEADAREVPLPEVISATAPPPPSAEPVLSGSPQVTLGTEAQSSGGATLSAGPMEGSDSGYGFISMFGLLFGGQPKWPEAIAAAIAFEGDGYVLRTLIINGDENRNDAIPFVPLFATGPPLVLASPSIFPADIDLFVAVSLDYNQIYQGMKKTFADAQESSRKFSAQRISGPTPAVDAQPESPFAVYEKTLGLKIKDDLLPLLGNELAIAIPRKKPQPAPANSPTPETKQPEEDNGGQVVRAPDQTPIIAISVKDKEAVRRLIPRIVESLGFKGANLFAQTEKRDATEITSYANIFSYAFVGDFLVLTPDPKLTRHVVDAYLNNETLSSDSHFRNSTRWQPRQVQGQVYAGAALLDLYDPFANIATVNEKMRNLLSRLNPVIEPLTYALSNDGLGPLHELHLPRNLLMFMIAGITSQANESPIVTNESIAQSLLRTIGAAQATFHSGKGDGRYGTLDELAKEGLISRDLFEKYGYKIGVTILSNKFEATAVPLEYGTTGRRSFFIDETGVLRGGDHGGGAATLSDKPIE